MKPSAHRVVLRRAGLLLAFWLILSGLFDPFHILLGVFSVLIVLWINWYIQRYDYFGGTAEEFQGVRVLRLFYFLLFLLWAMLVSSLKIARLILHPQMPIKAGLIKFRTQLPNMNSRVTLGNSITLTPGTVTLDISGNTLLVHSLTDQASHGHIDCQLVIEVSKLYFVKESQVVCEEQLFVAPEDY